MTHHERPGMVVAAVGWLKEQPDREASIVIQAIERYEEELDACKRDLQRLNKIAESCSPAVVVALQEELRKWKEEAFNGRAPDGLTTDEWAVIEELRRTLPGKRVELEAA